MTFRITATRTVIAGPRAITSQLPTFEVEASSESEARVKALAITLDATVTTDVFLHIEEVAS